jgi:hypothetical protein
MRVLGSSLLAVPFVVTAVLLGSATTPVSALASPGPYPMPFQNADYDARFIPSSSPLHANPRRRSRAFDRNTTTHSGHHTFHPSTSMGTLSGHKVHASAPATPSASRFHKRQHASLDVLLQSLSGYSSGSQSDSQDLREC